MRVDARHCCSLFRRVGSPGFVGARNWSSVVEGGGGGGGLTATSSLKSN